MEGVTLNKSKILQISREREKNIPSGLLRTLQLGPLHRSNYISWNLVTIQTPYYVHTIVKKQPSIAGRMEISMIGHIFREFERFFIQSSST